MGPAFEEMDMQVDAVFSRDPEIMSGAVVFAGTRVPAEALFENLADGMSLDEFLENFPTVERWQVEAALHLVTERVDRLVA
jgi:uncharacterized protein (DUF433 family)